MQIQQIIKRAIKRLEMEGKLLTPEYYSVAFCTEANKVGMKVEDCNIIENLKKTLNKDLQKELQNYRIKTIGELSRFLISKLNRSNPTQCSLTLESQTLFVKKVLQSIEILHNKEASELAKRSIELINTSASPSQLDQFKQLWANFLSTYDDTFLTTLKAYGEFNGNDLKSTIEGLNFNISQMNSSNDSSSNIDLEKIASVLIASLVPSIAATTNDKILGLTQKIKSNPKLLQSDNLEKTIRSAISLRISLDKKSVKEMIASLDNVLDKLSSRLINMIETSDSSTSDIQRIKKDLKSYNEESVSDFKLAHKKLFTIATALEENTQVLSKDLKNQNEEVLKLSQKVRQLEEELAASREESKKDFLTKLYNRRALDEFLAMKEAEFERYGHNFTVIMFDIDHFKNVNDSHGHDAGDAVLTAFAKIINNEARSVDIVGRFGGEEFLVILSETDTNGGLIFANKVREHVQKARFMYKGKRIEVTVSGGVAERVKHTSYANAIKSADECLYLSKENGRNQITSK